MFVIKLNRLQYDCDVGLSVNTTVFVVAQSAFDIAVITDKLS